MRLERGEEATIERAYRSHPGAERFEAEIAHDGAEDRFRRWTLNRIIRAEKQDVRMQASGRAVGRNEATRIASRYRIALQIVGIPRRSPSTDSGDASGEGPKTGSRTNEENDRRAQGADAGTSFTLARERTGRGADEMGAVILSLPDRGAPPQLEKQVQVFNSYFRGNAGSGDVPSAELAYIASPHLGLVATVPFQIGFGGQTTGFEDAQLLVQWLAAGSLELDNMLSVGAMGTFPIGRGDLSSGDYYVGPFAYGAQRFFNV
jgi:hypothetical protein